MVVGAVAVAAILFLLTLAAVAVCVNLARGRASRSWPRAEGLVVESELAVEPGGLEVPRLAYRYTVDGRILQGRRVSFHEVHGFRFSRRTIERYPEGARVEVAYHPTRPQLAVLEPGARPLNYLLALAFVPLAGAGLVLTALELLKLRSG